MHGALAALSQPFTSCSSSSHEADPSPALHPPPRGVQSSPGLLQGITSRTVFGFKHWNQYLLADYHPVGDWLCMLGARPVHLRTVIPIALLHPVGSGAGVLNLQQLAVVSKENIIHLGIAGALCTPSHSPCAPLLTRPLC